jgi:hypothetical protein
MEPEKKNQSVLARRRTMNIHTPNGIHVKTIHTPGYHCLLLVGGGIDNSSFVRCAMHLWAVCQGRSQSDSTTISF